MQIFLDFFYILILNQQLFCLICGTFHREGEDFMNIKSRVLRNVLCDLVDFQESISEPLSFEVCLHSRILELQLRDKYTNEYLYNLSYILSLLSRLLYCNLWDLSEDFHLSGLLWFLYGCCIVRLQTKEAGSGKELFFWVLWWNSDRYRVLYCSHSSKANISPLQDSKLLCFPNS